MVGLSEGNYRIEKRETLARTDELRLVVLTLAPGEEVPWHWHNNVKDVVLCMEGPMVVETRAPRERFELAHGDTCTVPAKRAHRVSGKDGGRCKFAILQGVGEFDYNPVSG